MRANTILHVEVPVPGNELEGTPVGGFARTGQKAWFEIRPLSSRELVVGQQIQSLVSHELKCAFFTGAHNAMRLTNEAGTRIFNVESVVNENESNRFLVWRCVEEA
jgi:SPP1 family predicted phage head-tail adaptor